MKILELKLKKEVIIVENEFENKIDFIDNELGIFYFLCKGSELTEEIASELVELTIMHLTYGGNKHKYRSYVNYNLGFDNALESFISAVESKEKFWLENPVQNTKPTDDISFYDSLEQKELAIKKWQEAEEKTFKNPLIFVKK